MAQPLSPENEDVFEDLQQLVLERTGLYFRPNQRDNLLRGLLLAARQAETASLSAYCQRLAETDTHARLWADLINHLTVGETYFFRDSLQTALLRDQILPELIHIHLADRRLRLWSAACATGEEPYSLAILLKEILPEVDSWQVTILATDINREYLKRARQGYYRKWSFRQTEPAMLAKYFAWDGSRYALAAEIKAMVTFRYLNMAEPAYPSSANNTHSLDLIMFRNMAIYLPETLVSQISERLYRALTDGGWLMVGAAELNHELFKPFTPRYRGKTIVYQKAPAAPPPAPPARPEPAASPISRFLPSLFAGPPPEPPEPAPAATVDALFLSGLELIRSKNLNGALQQLTQCLELDAGFALARYQIAAVYANQGRLPEARDWCLQTISLNPLLVEAHYLLALIYHEEQQTEAAVSQLKKVLYLDHSFCLAHFWLAKLYDRLNKTRQAQHHRSQTIRLLSKMSPDTPLSGLERLTAGELLAMTATG